MTSSYLNQSLANMKIAINLNERDIVKLIIEFLANRELHIAMLDLERETGIINSAYSDDILFLRQLILDGQWDDCIEFVQPLKQIEQFNWKQFYYLVLKSQYVELLCLKSEANTVDNQLSVDQLVAYLNDLKQYCPAEEDYKRLCYLLTVPRIQDLPEYKSWNPSTGRLTCFTEILPLISRFLPPIDQSKKSAAGNQIAQNERLVQLIVKGLLYEACVEYCQARATSSQENYDISDPNAVLMNQNLSETDASLLSWLHALSVETFSCPFEEKPLKLNMERFVKPTLEATWAEAILATPIKPQQLFPYNAVPSGRSKNMELMSRSLAPQYEGLTFGMTKSQLFTSGMEMKLTSSFIGAANNNNTNQTRSGDNGEVDKQQQSVESQTSKKLSELTKAIGLINTTNVTTMPSSNEHDNHHPFLNDIKEEEMVSSPTGSTTSSSNSSAAQRLTSNNNNSSTHQASSSMPRPTQTSSQPAVASSSSRQSVVENSMAGAATEPGANPMQDSQLFQEYRKHKAQVIQQFEEQEKKREEYMKQLKTPNVQNALSSLQLSVANQNGGNGGNKTYNDDELSFSSATKSPTGSQTGGSQAETRLSKSPRAPLDSPALATNTISPSPSFNNKPTAVVNNKSSSGLSNKLPAAAVASVHDSSATTRFESLEEITKAASFLPVSVIEDQQAVRAVDIHPSGNHYVVGSNSKCLRICSYPNLTNIKADHVCKPATVLYKKSKHHYGSIYCTAWNPTGNLIATGSNDKTIKLVKFNPDLTEDNDSEQEIAFHNGTVRDLVFMQQSDNNILISGGAGDCRINVLDCQTQQTLRNYSGHTGHIFSLYTWGSTKNVFVSGSQDKTIKFWDLRSPDAIQTVVPTTSLALEGSPVASVAVDSNGLIMASGHEDAACCLYDIRGSRIVQIFKPHTSDIRSVRFSSNAFYLLTASYDNRVIVTDLHGDLTKPLFSHTVAQHSDKVIQAKWHPELMSFVTTSADRTSIVWSLPSSVLAQAHVIDRD